MSRSTLLTFARVARRALTGALVVLGIAPAIAHAATRDIKVSLNNQSDTALTLKAWSLPDGCWAAGSPPQTVAIGQTAVIRSESCGVATGTEFTVQYTLDLTGQILTLHYNNPFAGSDDFDENVPPGYARSGGGTIEDRSMTLACDSRTCDGIADAWKTSGVTIDPEGPTPPQFVDLPKMGVQSDRPTVFVQLDWMQKTATTDTRLSQAAIDRVIRAYDRSPVTYRGASRAGIKLVVDHGPASTIEPGGAAWGALSRAGAVPYSQGLLSGWREPGYDLKNLYGLVTSRLGPAGRLPLFHYSISPEYIVASRTAANGATEFDTTSGYGVPWGFIVALGGFNGGTPTGDQQTGTFMHELGHTLSLRHGGEDDDNDKPQYASVMNYLFQFGAIPLAGGASVWDYSRTNTLSVNENSATEGGGLTGALSATFGTRHRCPDGTAPAVLAPAPIDWNCNGTADAADPNNPGFDINGDGRKTDLLGSSSDWERIRFKTGGVGAGTNPESAVPAAGATGHVDELTAEQAATILPIDTTAPSTTLAESPARNGAGWHRSSVTLTFSASDGAGSGVVRTEAAVDGGDFAAVTGPVVIADEGVHELRHRSIDRAGNVEASRTETVRIDRTDPETAATVDPAPNGAGWQHGPVTVNVAARDALSGVSSTTVASTGAVTTAPATTAAVAAALLVDRDGTTTVRHHATDRAGNSGPDVETVVRTDATPPSATIKAARQGLTITNRVTGTAADATSGMASLTVTYSPTLNPLNLGALGSTQTVQAQLTCDPARLECTWLAPKPRQLGLWKATAVARDIAGNADPSPPSAEIMIVL